MSRVWRRALSSLVVLGVAVLASSSAAADSGAPKATYALSAAADGESIVVANSSIPELPVIQANAPTAQATSNSRGQSTAYSTTPDPGQGTAELPLTVSGILCPTLAGMGVTVPGCDTAAAAVPAYPYAYAQAGDPPQDQNVGGAHLHAEATSTSSEAQTTIGAPGAGSATSTARASGSPSEGTASVSAESSVDGLGLSTALTITGIDAKASISIDSSGKATPSSSFELGSLKVAGMDVAYTNGGFVLLGSPTPVPVPISTVFASLTSLGITAEFIPAISTPTSVTSEGLQLSYTAPGAPSGLVPPLPSAGLPVGVGVPTTPTTVTYVLGRATVNAKYRKLPAAPDTDTFVAPSDSPTASTSSVPASTPTDTAPAVTPSSGQGTVDSLPPTTGGTDTTLPTTPDVAASSDAGTAPVTAPVTQTAAAAHRSPVTSHSVDIYLALVIAALGSFAAATAVRHLGVRLSWT